MQSEGQESNAAGEELDADSTTANTEEEKKVLVILKSSADSMKQPETFLKNRGWTILSTHKLRDTLGFIISQQPKYILIAADHSHKKVKMLPKILAQAFTINIIGFCEKSAGPGMIALQEMGLLYNLYPPVSGPAIERMILKIQKDLVTKQEESSRLKISGEVAGDPASLADGTGPKVFRGEDGKLITITGEEREKNVSAARSALAALMSESDVQMEKSDSADNGPIIATGSSAGAGIGYMPNQEPERDSSGAIIAKGNTGAGATGAVNQQGGGSSGGGYFPQGGHPPIEKGGAVWQQGQGRKSNPFFGGPLTKDEPGSAGYNPQDQGPNKGGIHYDPSRAGDPNSPQNPQSTRAGQEGYVPGVSENDPNSPFYNPQAGRSTSDNSMAGDSPSGDGSASQGGFPGQVSNQNSLGSQKTKSNVDLKARIRSESSAIIIKGDSNDTRSLFEVGVQQSIDQSLDELGEKILVAGEPRKVVCVTVESDKFNGYLVAAMGENRAMDTVFVEKIKTRLFAFLKSNGQSVSETETAMELKIAEVPFQDWSMECANFLVKTVHGNDEIAMAFFPSETTKVDLEQSVSEKMLQINLEELRDDTVMEFDLYIYMPENQRYLLYTPTGRVLAGEQKSRLVTKGVSHMHLRKENVTGVKRYRAQNFLNDKINEFKAAKGKKAK